MLGLRHPLTGAIYDLEADGTVTVDHDGRRGRFRGDGEWIEGELRAADPHLCGWLTSGQVRSRRQPVERPVR
ncbi:MAG: transposase [Acidimicrobiia bacterium]|nr:transposase [Acidimicrobiia bacterium]